MTDIFLKTAGMSITASFVIVAIILLRLMLKKAPKIFSYLLWTAAIFRLLCPVSFQLPSAPVAPVTVERTVINDEISSAAYTRPVNIENRTAENGEVKVYVCEKEAAADNTPKIRPVDIGAYIWFSGTVLMAAYGVFSYIGLKTRVKNAVGNDRILFSGKIDDPFIIGIFRPEIYLPEGLSHEDEKLIILHEKAHIRRLDHIAKLIMYLALCIHWFNPLVWLMFRLFERDMEMSCDERVTAEMSSEQKADYSQALLNISSKRAAAFTACFGESGTKQRVRNVLSFKRPAVWITALCAVIIAAAAVMLTANRAFAGNGAFDILADSSPSDIFIIRSGENGVSVCVSPEKVSALNDAIKKISLTKIADTSEYENSPENVINGAYIERHSGNISDTVIDLYSAFISSGVTKYYLVINSSPVYHESGYYGKIYEISRDEYERAVAEAIKTIDPDEKSPAVLKIQDPLSSDMYSGIYIKASDKSYEAESIPNSLFAEITFCGEYPDRVTLMGEKTSGSGEIITVNPEWKEYTEDETISIFNLESHTTYCLKAYWNEVSAEYYFKTGNTHAKSTVSNDTFPFPDFGSLTEVTVKCGDKEGSTKDFAYFANAVKNTEYTRITENYPTPRNTAAEITFSVSPYNRTVCGLFEADGKYFMQNLSTNSIHIYSISKDDYENILYYCNEIIHQIEKRDKVYVALLKAQPENKREIYHKMLNSIDYYDYAEGSMDYHGIIEFKTDIVNGVFSGNIYGEEVSGSADVPLIEQKNGHTVITDYLKREDCTPIADEDRVTIEEDGNHGYYHRSSSTNLGSAADVLLMPQALAMGYLTHFDEWDITGTETFLERECTVIEGTCHNDYGEKFGADHFRFLVDSETGVLLDYKAFSGDTVVRSIYMISISYTKPE